MFTGIVKGVFPIHQIQKMPGMRKFSIKVPNELTQGLQIGASVSIDGICLTATRIEAEEIWFDVIQETLGRTTLHKTEIGSLVNVERSAQFGDEIGGHILSGHVFGTAEIIQIKKWENNQSVFFRMNPAWIKYLFPKGYIAIDGISLTLVDVLPEGTFSVHLIPETLKITTLGRKKEGDLVNIEIDSQTMAIVDTVERVLAQKGK